MFDMWEVLKLGPGEESQGYISGAGKVISESTSSVQMFFQFNIDGFFDSSLKSLVFFVQNMDITVP